MRRPSDVISAWQNASLIAVCRLNARRTDGRTLINELFPLSARTSTTPTNAFAVLHSTQQSHVNHNASPTDTETPSFPLSLSLSVSLPAYFCLPLSRNQCNPNPFLIKTSSTVVLQRPSTAQTVSKMKLEAFTSRLSTSMFQLFIYSSD